MKVNGSLAKLLCLLMIGGFGSTAYADSFYLPMTKGVGVAGATAESEHELLRSALLRLGHQVQNAESGADFVLISKIVSLGSSLILQVEKRKGAVTLFATELKAAQVDELDRVTDRVVRAMLSEKVLSQEAKIDEVTQSEANKQETKFQARKHWQIGFGPAWASNLNTSTMLANFKISYAWQVKNYDLNFSWKSTSSVTSSEDVGFAGMLGLGGSYYLSQDSSAPFVSAGFGFGIATLKSGIEDSAVSGFAFSAGGGYAFLRTSQVNFEVYAELLSVLKSNSAGLPMALLTGIAINF